MIAEDLRALEAALFAAEAPMTPAELGVATGIHDIKGALGRLGAAYQGHGIELADHGGRFSFRTAPDLGHILRRERAEPRKLSRAEIEAIRGVQISKGTLDALLEAGWVRPAGRREVPGRPLTYATTPDFLDHFSLTSRRDLPGIDDLKAAGLLDPIDLAMEQQMRLETGDEEEP